jgi:hypothetical protein
MDNEFACRLSPVPRGCFPKQQRFGYVSRARRGADDKDVFRDFGKAVLNGEPLSQIQYFQASPFVIPFLNLAFDTRIDLRPPGNAAQNGQRKLSAYTPLWP